MVFGFVLGAAAVYLFVASHQWLELGGGLPEESYPERHHPLRAALLWPVRFALDIKWWLQ